MNPVPFTSRPFLRFLWYHLPVILYAAAILAVSSMTNLSPPQVRLIAIDKLAHFLEYAVFAYITFRSFSHLGKTFSPSLSYLLTILFVSLFAVGDEYFQSFIPGRVMDATDLLTDIFGAFLVTTFFWLRRRRIEGLQSPRKGQEEPPDSRVVT